MSGVIRHHHSAIEDPMDITRDCTAESGLSLVHINTRSLSKNFVLLESLLSELNNVDIIALSETWLDKHNTAVAFPCSLYGHVISVSRRPMIIVTAT